MYLSVLTSPILIYEPMKQRWRSTIDGRPICFEQVDTHKTSTGHQSYFVVCHNYNWLPRTYPYCLYNSFTGRTSHSFRVWIIFHLFPCCVEDAPTASQTTGAGTWHWHQIWAVPQFWLRILCNTIASMLFNIANITIWNIVDPWTRQVN